MAETSDLVLDTKLPVRFSAGHTHHDLLKSAFIPRKGHTRQIREEVWKKEKMLGRGGFGQVWLERCSSDDGPAKLRAVKSVQKYSTSGRSIRIYCTRELDAMAKFSRAKYDGLFAKSFGWYEDATLLYITMEYFEHGDLQLHLGRPLSESGCRKITVQILRGVQSMHSNDFVHRDLKPQNIFVASKGPEWWVKIGDFGLSKRLSERTIDSVAGTIKYLAPEVLKQLYELQIPSPAMTTRWICGQLALSPTTC